VGRGRVDVLRDRTLDAMARLGVRGTVSVTTYPDAEAPDLVEAVIEVRVSGLSYGEVLRLWDELAAEVFDGMDPEEVKDVMLVVDSEVIPDDY